MSKEEKLLRGNYNEKIRPGLVKLEEIIMAKIAEAQNRMFKNVFVCKNCQSKIRADSQKILKGKVKCRKCHQRNFRPLKKK